LSFYCFLLFSFSFSFSFFFFFFFLSIHSPVFSFVLLPLYISWLSFSTPSGGTLVISCCLFILFCDPQKVRRKEDSRQHELKVQFLWYGTTNKRDKSGAYLFLPDGQGQVSAATETHTMHVYWNCQRHRCCGMHSGETVSLVYPWTEISSGLFNCIYPY
jgi:hypothetical protein